MNANHDGDVVNPVITGSASRDERFYERCAVQTRAGSQGGGFHTHDIQETLVYRTQILLTVGTPITAYGSCTEANQCASGLFCNKAITPSRCTPKLPGGAPCCELYGGSCHDWCAKAFEPYTISMNPVPFASICHDSDYKPSELELTT